VVRHVSPWNVVSTCSRHDVANKSRIWR